MLIFGIFVIFIVRKSHTIKNKLLDVKKALPKNEMDRMNMNNRGGGRDMGNRGFGPRGDRANGGGNWYVHFSLLFFLLLDKNVVMQCSALIPWNII